MTELRPYQHDAIEAIRAAFRAGKRRVMLQLPTGGGKTLTGAAMLTAALGKGSRSLFVAHRKELIDQTVRTFARIGVTSIGVIRAGDKRADSSQPIQIASIQTLVRRSWPEAQIVFVDEAHRSAADSYVRLFEQYPNAYFVGLSATPCRTDGKPLGTLFDALIAGATYSELISGGHIVAPLVYSTPVLPDLSKVHTKGGDFDHDELEAAVNRSALIGNIVSEWTKRAEGRRTVAFAVSIAHSRAIVDQFTAACVRAEHLDGTTPEDEREAILARLENGATTIVSNVGVLCEGWDMPSCKCLILARPTKSLVLYMQMAGRILRPHDGETPLILDHGANVDRHGMPHEDREWTLSDKPKRTGAAPSKACPECFAYVPAAIMVCPHCGYEWAESVSEPVEQEELTHVELALRTLDGPDAELGFFRSLTRKAKEKGYAPGWINYRFEEKFGRLPDKAWWLTAKRAYRKDSQWQTMQAQRARAQPSP